MGRVILVTRKFDDGSEVKYKITDDETIKNVLNLSNVKGFIDLELMREMSYVDLDKCDVEIVQLKDRVVYDNALDAFMGVYAKT